MATEIGLRQPVPSALSILRQRATPNRQVMLMKQARRRATFDSRKLAYIIYSGKDALETREAAFTRVEDVLGTSDTSALPPAYTNLDRCTTFLRGLQEARAMLSDSLTYNHNIFETASHTNTLINSSPYGIHTSLFTTTLKLQCSPQQLKYWLPLAERGEIIGCYAQTELGHGTNIRGLETTATFDPERDEFVVHSPTLTSTKYWPGGLAFSSSHCILMARLIVSDKDHGVHAFIMQIRSLSDWSPLPGIELGDLGLKLGLNNTDNGYAVFTHHRIPRQALLMGNCSLTCDGAYTPPKHAKLSYATMIYGRVAIARVVSLQLAQACTIAIRYSVVREQGSLESDPNAPETAIFAYKSQHSRLLTHLSRAYALLFASKSAEQIHAHIVRRGKEGDHAPLAYGHPITAMLKAYATQLACQGVEDARKCTGGHGFSLLSGLPAISETVLPTATLEGENWVLWQQGTRYLVKVAAVIRAGKLVMEDGVAYLAAGYQEHQFSWREGGRKGRCPAQGREFLDPDVQISVFRHRAARLVFEAEALVSGARARGKSEAEAWNENMMALIYAARAHLECFVLETFIRYVADSEDAGVKKVLGQLCSLYALTTIESPASVNSMAFLEDGFLSGGQVSCIRAVVNTLLDQLVPEAVGLTDAWAFSDACLGSAIGGWEGDVYGRLMEWTRKVPVNDERKHGEVWRDEWRRWRRVVEGVKL